MWFELVHAFGRAARLMLYPAAEWRAIATEPPAARLVTGYLVPLVCIPALAWMAGLAMFGLFGARAEAATLLPPLRIGHIGLVTFCGTVLGVWLVAVSIWLIAPIYRLRRDWPRSLQLAIYAATPLLVAGVLLLVPMLVYVVVLVLGPALFGLHTGLRLLLTVKDGEAAEYVAIVCLAASVALTLLGGVAGALNLI